MKLPILTALAACFAMSALALEQGRYNPMDFEIERTNQTGKYLNHTIIDGPCTTSVDELRAHIQDIVAFPMDRFVNSKGEAILPLVGFDDKNAEGWVIDGDTACLKFITVLAGEGA